MSEKFNIFIKGLFCLFSSFSQHNGKYSTNLTIKSVDGVLDTQTRDGRMVGADESTELWRLPHLIMHSDWLLKILQPIRMLKKCIT